MRSCQIIRYIIYIIITKIILLKASHVYPELMIDNELDRDKFFEKS